MQKNPRFTKGSDPPCILSLEHTMKREIIRVEPLSTYLERLKAPTSAVTRHGHSVYVSGPAIRSRDR